jgi:hypothetical protein
MYLPGAYGAPLAGEVAARSLGYTGIADLILADQLGPRAISRLFTNGISRDHGKVLAVVLLAGSTARFNSCRQGWNGDLERDLAIKALGGEAGFVAANKQAVALVQSHWAEISAPGGVLTKKTQETRVRRLAAKYGYRLREARWAVGHWELLESAKRQGARAWVDRVASASVGAFLL